MKQVARILRRPATRQRGAALLLLLVVGSVAAASLLISAFSRSNVEQIRERRTVATLGRATDALVGFAATHGRLPRPAVSAIDGRERAQPCAGEQDCSGFLPWVDLGVEGVDSWGKVLRYAVTPGFTVPPIQRVSAIATKRVQARDGRGLLFYTVGQERCELAAQCAPAVVLSQGRRNLGTHANGLRLANGAVANLDEVGNDTASIGFISRAASDDPRLPGGEFDDLLAVVPLQTMYELMARARTLP
ncbi:hypothetical protein ACHMW6_14645 [Pseudoduganella sp. UC29_106]|uniref:hypothetical protein n=1 Tax=Pseudoduganella sp. UC29_106 TaxID=3374553 RepID=UPI00375816D7